jgi:hypothetical protein
VKSMASVEAEFSDAIQAALQRFGDHEDMSPGRILRWLMQFADDDLDLGQKILEEVHYLNSTNIRTMARNLAEAVRDEFGASEDRIVFVPIAQRPGGGADLVIRALRGMKEPFAPRVATMVDLPDLDRTTVDALIFVDDFSGTGDTVLEWWENVETLVRPVSSQVVIAALIMTIQAAEAASTIARTASVLQIGEEANVFAEASGFTDIERQAILTYCEAMCSDPTYVRGYGECGLLLAFRHGCPDNSLPILWYSEEGWDPLFIRRAI